MALTAENTSNAGQVVPKTLLSFVNQASSSIQENMTLKKKRNVNVKKYFQRRVKRLNGPKTSSQLTKTKSVPKPSSKLEQSRSWPLLDAPYPTQTQGMETCNQSTLSSPPYSYNYACNSETSLYQQQQQPSSKQQLYDPELESIISALVGDSQPSTRHSSTADFQPAVNYPQQSTLESQVYLAEHPYSPPTSDCSDDLFDDSAYSSPVGSVGGYASRSPMPPAAEWPLQSPPVVTTSAGMWYQEQPPQQAWMPQYTTFNQPPQNTAELLLDRPFF